VKLESSCGHRTRTKGRRRRSVVTAIGKIAIERHYRVCRDCADAGFAADPVLGLEGFVTRRALRQICRVGGSNSFERSKRTLQELSGWSIDAETIRRLCHAEAARCRDNEAERREVAASFLRASGHRELQIDAGKVDTETGWRDLKVASFAVRAAGGSSTSEDYEQRELPKPSVRRVIAAIETAETFGLRCHGEAQRLGMTDASTLTVLGDGAEWIWNIAAERFAKAEQNLDVYHATEYLAALAQAGFGDDLKASQQWTKSARGRWMGRRLRIHARERHRSNEPRGVRVGVPTSGELLGGPSRPHEVRRATAPGEIDRQWAD